MDKNFHLKYILNPISQIGVDYSGHRDIYRDYLMSLDYLASIWFGTLTPTFFSDKSPLPLKVKALVFVTPFRRSSTTTESVCTEKVKPDTLSMEV